MIRYIIFDMDGVLINSEPFHYEIWQRIFAERGLVIDFEHYKGCIGSTVKRLMELIWEGYGVDFRGDATMPARFKEVKAELIAQRDVPRVPGVTEVIPKLKEMGYTLAIASSSPQDYIEFCMEKLGIADCFTVMFSGERVANPKPAPDVFLAAAEALGADPSECLVVEDSTNGSRAAKAAGMKCLGFPNPDSGDQDLSAAEAKFYPFVELLEIVDRRDIYGYQAVD